MRKRHLIGPLTLMALLAACGEPEPIRVPNRGEWILTFTPNEGEAFMHALQITADVSGTELQNAGAGFQELCADECSNTRANGFGFIGDLILSHGSAFPSLAIFTQQTADSGIALKLYTTEPITTTINAEGQEALTSDAAWVKDRATVVEGTLTAVRVGSPRELEGFGLVNIEHAAKLLREFAHY